MEINRLMGTVTKSPLDSGTPFGRKRRKRCVHQKRFQHLAEHTRQLKVIAAQVEVTQSSCRSVYRPCEIPLADIL